MRLLDRYVLRQTLGPLSLGLLVFTFIMLLDVLFDSAEMIIQRNVAAEVVGQLLLLSLPHIVVLTIPMALLFALLITVGRLSADGELVAIRASGLGLFSLYRPLLLLSLMLTALTLYLSVYVLPRGNQATLDLQMEIVTKTISQQVKERVFYTELSERLLYVFDRNVDDDRWRGVFLAEALPKSEQQLTIGEFGTVVIDESTGKALLTLENARQHEVDVDVPQDYQISDFPRLQMALEDRAFRSQQEYVAAKDLRSMSLQELLQIGYGGPANPSPEELQEQAQAQVEIHKKIAVPAACLVFGLFGVPLGFNNRRGGRSSGFAISIAIFLFYYIVLGNGERAATTGRMEPWLAMWLPNLLLATAGAFLLWRRNRDKSLLLGRMDRWANNKLWPGLRRLGRLRTLRRLRKTRRRDEERRAVAEAPQPLTLKPRRQKHGSAAARVVFWLELPRLRLFNTLDRYILTIFVKVLLIVTAASLSLYIVANLTEKIDEVLENGIPIETVVEYYAFLSFDIFRQIAPIIVLLTTLVTFGLLSHSNEITAAKALGISLYRLALPVVFAAMGLASFVLLLEDSVLPSSNTRVAELEDEILNRRTLLTYRRADRQWFFGQGTNDSESGYIYNYRYFDANRQTLQRLQVFRFDERHRMTGRLYATTAEYRNDGRWYVQGAWAREFTSATESTYTALPGPQPVDLPEGPDFFGTQVKQPEQMNRFELAEYVDDLEGAGEDVPNLRVQLHNKLALPTVCFVMALVALPFAFRLGKRGALYGVGLALILGMVYFAIIALFTTLGEASRLPPIVAAWAPNVLFGTFSLYLFLGVRT